MAIQLAHEIRPIPGIEFIPLPAECQRTFVFSAGLGSKARDLSAAKALLRFLAGPEAKTVIQAKGMDLLEILTVNAPLFLTGSRIKSATS